MWGELAACQPLAVVAGAVLLMAVGDSYPLISTLLSYAERFAFVTMIVICFRD